MDKIEYVEFIGESTPTSIAQPMTNFFDCLMDTDSTFPKRTYKIFKMIRDCGIQKLKCGNAGGGIFDGPYRSFNVKYNGDTKIVSIGMSTYITDAKPDIVRTVINVAIDNGKMPHHSLQIVVDDNLSVVDDVCTFYHHGRITIGNKGPGKIDGLRKIVKEYYPEIIDGKRFNLGKIKNNRQWKLTDPAVISIIENMISYALLRDDYRKIEKAK